MAGLKPRVVVLGGGVAGLSAALHVLRTGEFEVDLFEGRSRVGGLATSYQLGPATFDFGPHAFHSQQPEVIDFFCGLMRGEYYEIEKNVAIQFDGRLYPYPLNPIKALRNMPLTRAARCGFSYLWNLATNHRSLDTLRTSEEFFVRNYGRELYRVFFEGYTHKVWGIHPRDLSAEFIKNRLPPTSLLRIAWTALTGIDIKVKNPNQVPLKLRIFYPKGGSIRFPQAMAREVEGLGGRIHLGTRMEAVHLAAGRVVGVTLGDTDGSRRVPCDVLISTVPLTDLVRSLEPAMPPETVESAGRLVFRPLLIACLWIEGASIFPYQTIYYTNRIFNRLAQMNSYSPETVPSGTCGVTAELTCSVGDELWTMDERALLRKVVEDMEAERLVSADRVKDAMLLREVHGYPIYDLSFEKHLFHLRQTVHAIPNLYVSGRQGMFNYAQMHYGVSAGMAIARHLLQGGGKPPLPERGTEDALFA